VSSWLRWLPEPLPAGGFSHVGLLVDDLCRASGQDACQQNTCIHARRPGVSGQEFEMDSSPLASSSSESESSSSSEEEEEAEPMDYDQVGALHFTHGPLTRKKQRHGYLL